MSNENYKKYVEELKSQLEEAEKKFNKAKEEAIKTLEKMSVHEAVDFGAAYVTHIDKVTAAAAELRKIHELLRIAEYFKKNEE